MLAIFLIFLFICSALLLFFFDDIYKQVARSPADKISIQIMQLRSELASKSIEQRIEDMKLITLLESQYALCVKTHTTKITTVEIKHEPSNVDFVFVKKEFKEPESESNQAKTKKPIKLTCVK